MPTHPKYELKESKNGQFYFNLTAKNGQVIATSEMYTTKDAALEGIESVKHNAPKADIERHFYEEGWQPIETAPNFDEQVCLVSDGRLVCVAVQLEDGIYYHDYPDNYNLYQIHRPTHWMPLPEPPKTGDNDG